MFSFKKFEILIIFSLLFIFIPELVLAGDCCYNRAEDVCRLKPGTICPERLGYEEVNCVSTPGCPTPPPPSPTESLTCFCCNGANGFQDELSSCESFCSEKGGVTKWSVEGIPEVRIPCPLTSPDGSTTGGTGTTPSGPPTAQKLINPLGGTNEAPGGVTSVPALIANIIKTILGVVGAVALFMFVWGGFGWLTSGGNPDKVKQGRDTLVWATIGLLVIFASYTLVDVVFRALGAI